ncbi:hypothetical protein MPK67_gp053 [Erwinia phage pEa_SNUABM_32]|uniref:Uncharacterized protein n=1 Tax=Erwinia phage pEa_SNUABM_32 TaxID=2869555 RepID=A0AAE7XKM4_9CAUD|nr:hypothetical protein MPK67_gp053 [Erwinia phage pEa_SNUABM_32]QZE56926.1 hypothetical protein pEaSNUABM32_00053 [Erwinia phage pEa_SNUABM_32]
MSYTITRGAMIAFVQNGQLQCRSIKVKASGIQDVYIYNKLAGLQALLNTKIFTQGPSGADVLPTDEYIKAAHCLYTDLGILKRLERMFSDEDVTIRIIDKQRDTPLSVASVFWIDRKDMIAFQVLETDKKEHNRKTILITEAVDVKYPGNPTVLRYDADEQCVYDTDLCNNVYTLHGWNETVTHSADK